ncbi:metalloregulator ArsR/SmtB family transcription factor [Acidocella sp.]|uniref:ArsR/SmtB family transcription factor n=1 Tax=Acidocella sp. TaxID=50710 RepID=UPI002608DC83|nr:metalloregulator ArsR/SmtB family transcription factor [Acidocella sp.]
MLNQQTALDLTFQALADPGRRAMLERLSRGPAAVSELAQPLTMSLPAVLQHLNVLETAGLVTSQKTGRIRTCQIAGSGLSAAQAWLADRRAEWEARFDRLETYLNGLQEEDRNGCV